MMLRERAIAWFLTVFCVSLLAGCATSLQPIPSPTPPVLSSPQANVPPVPSKRGGYYQDDGPGDSPPPNLMQTPDAEPKIEPYSKAASRSYQVFGKTYNPITDERPFKQRGMGSWYGRKFHGLPTSIGEPYDMYKMTAAHPTLPIPSYARITSVETGRSVVVRINDRGPFLSNRIADLSYTAALKLGFMTKGSHEIEVERILPDEIARMQRQPKTGPEVQLAKNASPSANPSANSSANSSANPSANPSNVSVSAVSALPPMASSSTPLAQEESSKPNDATKPGFYLQLGAYSQAMNAESLRNKLANAWQAMWPTLQIVQAGALYRLYSGPFESRAQAVDVAQQMQNEGIAMALVVQR
jgi:rare lipoprotein A